MANPDGWTALRRDLLEFITSDEPDESAIGRPERPASSFGAVEVSGLLLIEVLNPEPWLTVPGYKGNVPSVG